MRRLKVIDLSTGSQPIRNEDGTLWIVFNGEIYNFPDLKKDLEAKGHVFYTSTDTECILHLYEEHGEDCVEFLCGMFAFAIWDEREGKLFLARDRFGKKPLHYYADGRAFVFGSEIKSLLRHPAVPKRVREPAVADYFAFGYVPDPYSMFEGILKLPPGHCLTFRGNSATVRRYWDLRFAPEPMAEPEAHYVERAEAILDEAVRIRLISDVPLGAFLSGGVDSSLVVALMARHSPRPVKTFSIGFEEQKYDELPYARMVAERYGTEHHEEIVRPDADMVIRDLMPHFDEPFSDSSAIPTYYVCRMARKHVTVALSGDGGDELFAGYDRYGDAAYAKWSTLAPPPLRRFLLRRVVPLFPEGMPGINMLRYFCADEDMRYAGKMTRGVGYLHGEIFSADLAARIGSTDPSPTVLRLLAECAGADTVSRRQFADVRTYLPGDILTKVDRTSMLVSLEARAPLLDHRVAEFAATLPVELKWRNGAGKYLLKKVAERHLPPELLHRPKMGFAVPVSEWINGVWRDLSEDLVLGGRALGRGYFNPAFLRRILREHRRGRRDHGHFLWSLMVLELWCRGFIDKSAGKSAGA